MKTEVNQSKLVGITDIRKQYINLSPKRIRRFVKLYLDPKLIGNRLFVEREKLEDNIAVIYCQNGHLFSLPPNRRVGKLIICGVFYIVGVKDGLLQSLTDTDVVKYSLQYWRSESYTDDEIIDSWLQYPA